MLDSRSFNFWDLYNVGQSLYLLSVRNVFPLLLLQEFRSLRHVLKSWKPRGDCLNGDQTTMTSPECSSSNHSQDSSSVTGGYFARYSEAGSPFDLGLDEVQEEDILANIGVGMAQTLVIQRRINCWFRVAAYRFSFKDLWQNLLRTLPRGY